MTTNTTTNTAETFFAETFEASWERQLRNNFGRFAMAANTAEEFARLCDTFAVELVARHDDEATGMELARHWLTFVAMECARLAS